MSFGLGSLTNLLDPGALVHKAVDSVLPKDQQWIGGALGAVVDGACGNAAGAAAQGVSALADLEDVPQSATANKPPANDATSTANKTIAPSTSSASKVTFQYEPPPPQPRATTTTTTTTSTTTTRAGAASATATTANKPPASATGSFLGAVQKELADAAQHASASTARTASPTASGGGWRAAPPPPPSPTITGSGWRATSLPKPPPPPPPSRTATTTTTTTTTTTVSSGSAASQPSTSPPTGSTTNQGHPTVGQILARVLSGSGKTGAAAVAASSSASTSQPAGTTKTSTGDSSTKPATSDSSTKSASSDSSTKQASASSSATPSTVDPSTLSEDNFLKLSDDDLTKAVRDGKIPTDVTDSQAGMMALQERMNHISEMNQMMTSMMQAIHQMKMGVIENLRV